MTRSPRRLREHVKDTVSELPIHAARLAVMGVGRALLLTDRVRKDYRDARESGLGPVLGRLKNDAGSITGMVVGKVAGNGKAEEESKSRATDSEISIGKPKPAGTSRPPSSQRPAPPSRPATAPPSRPAAASRPKPATTATPPTPKPAAPKPTTSKPASKPAVSKPAASKPAASKPTTSKATASTPKPAAKPKPAAQAKPSPQAKPAAKPKATESKPATQAKPSGQAKPSTQAKPAASATPSAKAKDAAAAGLPVSGYDEATLASVRARLRGLDAKQVTELRDYERSHAARADFLRMYENRIAKLRGER